MNNRTGSLGVWCLIWFFFLLLLFSSFETAKWKIICGYVGQTTSEMLMQIYYELLLNRDTVACKSQIMIIFKGIFLRIKTLNWKQCNLWIQIVNINSAFRCNKSIVTLELIIIIVWKDFIQFEIYFIIIDIREGRKCMPKHSLCSFYSVEVRWV